MPHGTARGRSRRGCQAEQLAAAPVAARKWEVAKPVAEGDPAGGSISNAAASKHWRRPQKTKANATDKPEVQEVETKVAPEAPKKAKGEPGDPSFDELLKEAGVDQKKDNKPTLEKKSLSGQDFKTGMAAIAAKAQACYKGTQGTASVKLTIAPSGHVSKVAVGGLFAGKPEADCVVSAVKGASFPAWDGGPQSFGYSYLLSE